MKMQLHPEISKTMMSTEDRITRGRTRKESVKTKKARQKKRFSRTNADFTLRPTMNGRTVSKIQKNKRNRYNCNKYRKKRDKEREENNHATRQKKNRKKKKKCRRRRCYNSEMGSDESSVSSLSLED